MRGRERFHWRWIITIIRWHRFFCTSFLVVLSAWAARNSNALEGKTIRYQFCAISFDKVKRAKFKENAVSLEDFLNHSHLVYSRAPHWLRNNRECDHLLPRSNDDKFIHHRSVLKHEHHQKATGFDIVPKGPHSFQTFKTVLQFEERMISHHQIEDILNWLQFEIMIKNPGVLVRHELFTSRPWGINWR